MNKDMMDVEDRLALLRSRLHSAEIRLLYLDQLRPLVKGTCGEGYMNKISFEQMSEYAILWMHQEGIE